MMVSLSPRLALTIILPLFAAGCVTSEYSEKDAGFGAVALKVDEGAGKTSVWIQSQKQAMEIKERVKRLMAKKYIDAETAVQVAILNNKELQAAYADLGDSAADVWQTQLAVLPSASIKLTGIGTPGLDAYRILEGAIVSNLLALASYDQNKKLAEMRFHQAQLNAAIKTISLAADTRRQWLKAVAAWEIVTNLDEAKAAADAASELALKIGEAGSMTKANQAREHVFYADLAGETAKARLEARLAKEELVRLMGLAGTDSEFQIPNRLPTLPKSLIQRNEIEAEAIQKRMDLQVARLELQATAKAYGLENATRFISDIGLQGVYEVDRSAANGEISSQVSKTASLEIKIPIFDSGQARLRKGELAYMRAANELAALAANVRSEAKSSYLAYRANYAIARHYRNNVLPLRSIIQEQSQLSYNGMITSTFELIADAREKINSTILAVNANRDFWVAEADLAPVVYGGKSTSSQSSGKQ
jgi:outer membrane protein TolC